METQTKTLSVRLRDKHVLLLRQLAFEVNQVWNAANAESAAFSRIPIPGVGWIHGETSAFALQKSLQGMRTERAPHLHSHTYQEVIAEHGKKRRQFKTDKLRWRCSGGSKRLLGWIPFKVGSAVWKNGQVRYNGQFFKVWDSYGLSQYPFRSGCFSEDTQGRWYFNVAVSVPIQHSGATAAVGIDLGLKDYATCSDGVKLEASQIYRNAEERLAKAQRAGNTKQVRTIHAKIKNRRKDVIHKFTTLIARSHGLIVVGDVSSSKLAKTRMAKSVLDAGWFMLKTQLKDNAIGQSVVFAEVVCSCCGSLPDSRPKRLSGLRHWVCSDCGATHDRDINAAQNILNVGVGGQSR